MFGVESDYFVSDEILWIEPILIQWLKINREYLEEYDCDDCLYWYNERASISSVAGAVWSCLEVGGFQESCRLKLKVMPPISSVSQG